MENLLFCGACGSFRRLLPDMKQRVHCDKCDFTMDLNKQQRKMQDCVRQVNIERSQLLHRLYNSKADKGGSGENDEAVIDEACPKCNHPRMSFHTAQLRGVDEGQTIFYTCLNGKCGHKFTVNS